MYRIREAVFGSPIDFSPMSNFRNEDVLIVIPNVVNNAVVTDSDSIEVGLSLDLGCSAGPWIEG